MSSIRCKNTQIELVFRKHLYRLGYRYRIHYKKLPGKPDLVFPKKRVAVFIDSHFWHGYNFKDLKKRNFRNKSFWIAKIKKNMERDKVINYRLMMQGWRIVRIWEHELKNGLELCVNKLNESLIGR